MAEMGKFIEEMAKAGVLLFTDGCAGSRGARVGNLRESHRTDGPFTETKELIAGFAIVRAKSKAEAISPKRFLRIAGDGESEIRDCSGLLRLRLAMTGSHFGGSMRRCRPRR